ncbi:MAG: hypothetical protein H5T99_11765, partial [Moorella sp. (in: Bacteria)]|nr:hypothetical protein [Moorella sp. (in: firmicutes)]
LFWDLLEGLAAEGITILVTVVDAMLQGIDARVQEIFALPLSPPEKLQAIVRAVAENVRFLEPYFFPDLQRYYPHLWEKIERFRAERMARLEQIYLDGCRRGYFKEFNVEVLMNCFVASVRAVINPAFLTSHNISLPRALDTLVEIFLYGISKPMS